MLTLTKTPRFHVVNTSTRVTVAILGTNTDAWSYAHTANRLAKQWNAYGVATV